MKKLKKLVLKKESIAVLDHEKMAKLNGGGTSTAPCRYMCEVDPEWSTRAGGSTCSTPEKDKQN